MKLTLYNLLKLGAMLAASSTLAYANPLSEPVAIDGGNSAITPVPTSTTDSISFPPDSFHVTSVTTAPNGSLIFYGSLGNNPRFAALDLTSETDTLSKFHGTPTVSSTPEPSSLFLLGTGLVGAAVLVLRKHRSSGV